MQLPYVNSAVAQLHRLAKRVVHSKAPVNPPIFLLVVSVSLALVYSPQPNHPLTGATDTFTAGVGAQTMHLQLAAPPASPSQNRSKYMATATDSTSATDSKSSSVRRTLADSVAASPNSSSSPEQLLSTICSTDCITPGPAASQLAPDCSACAQPEREHLAKSKTCYRVCLDLNSANE